jgi:coenzyme F420-dependent glucose-6-phosphate dehydrogenase
LISTTPGDEIINTFKDNGGGGKPCFGQVKVCWANSMEEAKRTMQKWWPVSALSGRLHVDLPTPKHFEDAVELMGEPEIPEDSIMGPDPDVYLKAIQSLQANGYDHIYLHQVGPDQQGFLEFYKNSLAPLLEQENLITDSA